MTNWRREMKKIFGCLFLTGCFGYTQVGGELVGQVKKVSHVTPLICPNYAYADVSLGVMRNGVGSMSREDLNLYVMHADDAKILAQAAEAGSLVKITYDVARLTFCVPGHVVTRVEAVK